MKDSNGQDLQVGDKVLIEAEVVCDLGEAIGVVLKDRTTLELHYSVLTLMDQPAEPPLPSINEP